MTSEFKGWNFGDILDTIIPILPPEHPALIHGERVITWSEMDRRSNNLARALLARDIAYGDKVSFYMRNRPEYMETLAACFRGRLAHVNVNYRYIVDEVQYIFDNSDSTVVVYGQEFRDNILELRKRLDKVKVWVEVGDGKTTPDGILKYEDLVSEGDGSNLDIEREPSDLLFLYTGGTTGMPKGVMWEHHNLREVMSLASRALGEVPETLAALAQDLKTKGRGEIYIPACPLMHGTGLFTALSAMMGGGTIITLGAHSLDAQELWQAVETHKVENIAIVGDAFAKPMLAELDANPGRYDLSSLVGMLSSGVMWSVDIKQALLEHMPQVLLTDSFGSSEAVGFGSSITAKDAPVQTAKFTTNDLCKVFDENDNEIARGSETPGFIAFGGPIPLGYYKDAEKTAKIFKTIDGHRYSIPGDYCLVAEDGTLTLLGRGSVCINSAGEKIYPEEVEETLKLHAAVEDALVIGVPDEKWGQAVTAVVELAEGEVFDAETLRLFVREKLAAYKTPKHIFTNGPPFRAPNGKADYKSVTKYAVQQIANA
ncbi:MAG: acyl-CoA synthetase [Alphaproteobacteria bacterium]|nr:acyl-CoA synthetase [Alphaproteobacteria bacterium]